MVSMVDERERFLVFWVVRILIGSCLIFFLGCVIFEWLSEIWGRIMSGSTFHLCILFIYCFIYLNNNLHELVTFGPKWEVEPQLFVGDA